MVRAQPADGALDGGMPAAVAASREEEHQRGTAQHRVPAGGWGGGVQLCLTLAPALWAVGGWGQAPVTVEYKL